MLRAVVLLVVVGLAAAGCGASESEPRPAPDRTPGALDLEDGTYRDVGLGDTFATVGERLGSGRRGLNEPFQPLGDTHALVIGVPPSPRNPKGIGGSRQAWRFEDAAFVAGRKQAWLAVFSGHDARSREGLGVGSSLDDVRRAFPDSYCAIANEGTEYVSFPFCTSRVAPGVFAWFGYDPVRSVTFSRGAMACPPKGTRPRAPGCTA